MPNQPAQTRTVSGLGCRPENATSVKHEKAQRSEVGMQKSLDCALLSRNARLIPPPGTIFIEAKAPEKQAQDCEDEDEEMSGPQGAQQAAGGNRAGAGVAAAAATGVPKRPGTYKGGSSGSSSARASQKARVDEKTKQAKRQMEEAMLKLMVSALALQS